MEESTQGLDSQWKETSKESSGGLLKVHSGTEEATLLTQRMADLPEEKFF